MSGATGQDVKNDFCCGDHTFSFTAHRHRPLSPKTLWISSSSACVASVAQESRIFTLDSRGVMCCRFISLREHYHTFTLLLHCHLILYDNHSSHTNLKQTLGFICRCCRKHVFFDIGISLHQKQKQIICCLQNSPSSAMLYGYQVGIIRHISGFENQLKAATIVTHEFEDFRMFGQRVTVVTFSPGI